MARNVISTCVLFVCLSCGAGTVQYTIPVLTVRTDGQSAMPGSGMMQPCLFSYVATTNESPVRVSIVEDVPSGVGSSLRASLWLAATTASLALNNNLAGVTVSFETSGYVDGPSAGGMLCLAVMSAIEGRVFPNDFAMTGTIMADGTIGTVGGVAEKIRAAGKAGIKRVCIPASVRMDEDYTDLLDLGKKLNIEMHQVSTVAEAFQVMHRLPARQVERLNSADVCRLSPNVEDALKSMYAAYIAEWPADRAKWTDLAIKSFEEYRAGLFGPAALDIAQALEDFSCSTGYMESPDPASYPALARELSTNAVASAGGYPTKTKYAEELAAFNRDLINVEGSLGDADQEASEQAQEGSASGVQNGAAKSDDWFNDEVVSPSGSQFATIINFHYAKTYLNDMAREDITKAMAAVDDLGSLDVGQLNDVRSLLIAKMNLIVARKLIDDHSIRLSGIYEVLSESIPYIRTNKNVRQVENAFYRTMMAMDAALIDAGLQDDNPARAYRAVFNAAESSHEKSAQESEVLNAVFSEAQALAAACALMMCQDTDPTGKGLGSSAFFSSAVSTARENAIANISECLKLGIPCVMPVINFHFAEYQRDAYSAVGDAEYSRRAVLECYLHASLAAKALILCFSGQKLELNGKGFCCKHSTIEALDEGLSCRTIGYLGVNGEHVLRDGFSGYRRAMKDGSLVYTSWLDLAWRDVRVQSTNECWTEAYDASGRRSSKTYCNESWMPTPRKDGVLFETFGYDADGNCTTWEMFGSSSNRVLCADGIAVIKCQYNKRRQETRREYFGVNGEPVVYKDGFASYEKAYDKNGNLRKTAFKDCKGNLVVALPGYAWEECKYNAQNRETERAWYDAQGKLVCIGGVAKIRYEYDEGGRVTSQMFFGIDDCLTRCAENFAIARWAYNQDGVLTEGHYYGPDGKPTQHRDAGAGWVAVFDASGNVVGRKHYDLSGNEIDISQGEEARQD